jgi:Wzt C-terminal domain
VDHGTVIFDGEPNTAVAEYRRVPWTRSAPGAEHDARDIKIGRVQLLDHRQNDTAVFAASSRLTVRIGYEARRPVRGHFAVDIYSADGVYCAGINSRMDRRDFGVLSGAGVVDLAFPRLSLLPGCYVISVGILDAQGLGPLDVQHRAYPFSVASDERDLGLVHLERAWRHESHAPVSAGVSAAGGLE